MLSSIKLILVVVVDPNVFSIYILALCDTMKKKTIIIIIIRRRSHCIDFTGELSIHYNLSMLGFENAQLYFKMYKIRWCFAYIVFFYLGCERFASLFFFLSLVFLSISLASNATTAAASTTVACCWKMHLAQPHHQPIRYVYCTREYS